MLVAKRDPFHPGAQDNSHPALAYDGRAPRMPRLARTMSGLQMLGTLLAIPLGLASGYTMYRSNFSPDATCQSLRANIVSMLDKSVDARTRHMLVRKDVEAFERSCGSVDPDATAAFKALLASDQAAAHAPAEARPAEEKQKEIVRKVEAAKADVHEAVAEKPKPRAREATLSDAAWLAAVRGALTPAEVQAAKPAEPQKAVASAPPAVAPVRVVHEAHPKNELRTSLPPSAPPVSAPPVGAEAAPALPPPATIVTAPGAAPQPDADHPVPPASVPIVAETQPSDQPHRSWVGEIPFVGKMIEAK
jgi:hypothetical protein